jgi:hypothetical protein
MMSVVMLNVMSFIVLLSAFLLCAVRLNVVALYKDSEGCKSFFTLSKAMVAAKKPS